MVNISQDDSNIHRSITSTSQELDCIQNDVLAIRHAEPTSTTRLIQTRNNLVRTLQTENSLNENFNQLLHLRDHEDREIILSVADVAAASIPIVQEMTISDDSRVHFGPEFHSIERTVYTEEVIKGRVLGLEVTSTKKSNSIRCGFIVFIICALVVGSGMVHHYVKYGIVQRKNPIMDLDVNEWWYLRRADWQARPSYNTRFLRLPVRFVIIGHSERESCEDKQSCIKEVQNIQIHDQDRKNWDDIGPNFIISGQGLVFEGRGVNLEGNMVSFYDFNSITVMFLGDYRTNQTVPQQFHHLNDLLRQLVRQGVLRRDYDIAGHCQIDPRVKSPGRNILFELGHLTHWWYHNWEFCFGWV